MRSKSRSRSRSKKKITKTKKGGGWLSDMFLAEQRNMTTEEQNIMIRDVIMILNDNKNLFLSRFIKHIYKNILYSIDIIKINTDKNNIKINFKKQLTNIDDKEQQPLSDLDKNRFDSASFDSSLKKITLLQNNKNIDKEYKYDNIIKFEFSSDREIIINKLQIIFEKALCKNMVIHKHKRKILPDILFNLGLYSDNDSITLKLNDNTLKNIFAIINDGDILNNTTDNELYLKKNKICDMLVFILKESVFFKNIHDDKNILSKIKIEDMTKYSKKHASYLFLDIKEDIVKYLYKFDGVLINVTQNYKYLNEYNIEINNSTKNVLFESIVLYIDTKTNKNKIIFKLNKLYKYTYYKYCSNISPIIDYFNYEPFPFYFNVNGLHYDVKENNLYFSTKYSGLDLIKIMLNEDTNIKKYTQKISSIVYKIKLTNILTDDVDCINKIKYYILNIILHMFNESDYMKKYKI